MTKSNVKNSFLKGENNNFSYLSQITVKKCIINVPIKSALAVKISRADLIRKLILKMVAVYVLNMKYDNNVF